MHKTHYEIPILHSAIKYVKPISDVREKRSHLPSWASFSSPLRTWLCLWWGSPAGQRWRPGRQRASAPQTPVCWSACRRRRRASLGLCLDTWSEVGQGERGNKVGVRGGDARMEIQRAKQKKSVLTVSTLNRNQSMENKKQQQQKDVNWLLDWMALQEKMQYSNWFYITL